MENNSFDKKNKTNNMINDPINNINNDFLFELSWEVCNKMGGIYTVITSKISTILKSIKYENYFLIGPYLKNENNAQEFIKIDEPKFIKKANLELENTGIKIHYGKWKTPSSTDTPQVLLIQYLDHSKNINDIKKTLWEKYKIDSLGSNWYDFDEAILWSWASGIAIEKIQIILKENDDNNFNNENNFNISISQNTLIHAHEWMSGGSIFYIKSKENQQTKNRIKTIFTTHATMLGRALSGNGYNIYEMEKNQILIQNFDANKKAYEIGVHTKFQSEKALATISDCFTTVSDITAKEAEIFFKKSPDKLLYNGFNPKGIQTLENISLLYTASRNKINTLIQNHFFNYYQFDLNQTQIFYTSGRNEYRNKGVDIYIKALGLLNKHLKKNNSNKTILNIFLIPIGTFEKINHNNENKKLFNVAPLSTHNVPVDNEIIKELINQNLLNQKQDNVKVLLIPTYLNANDDIFEMNYYDVIAGLDLGIFPSFYEPWGYTPLESIAYATPTITTDFAGFARACLKDYAEQHTGVDILKRENILETQTINEFYELLKKETQKPKEEIQNVRNQAKEFAKNFTWDKFIQNYLDCYEIAKTNKL